MKTLAAAALAVLVLLLPALSLAQETRERTTSELDDEARAAFAAGNWATAARAWGDLRDRLREPSQKADAEVKVAHAHFRAGDTARASEALGRAFALDRALVINASQYPPEFVQLVDLARVKGTLGGSAPSTPAPAVGPGTPGAAGGAEDARERAVGWLEIVSIERSNPYFVQLDAPPRPDKVDLLREAFFESEHLFSVLLDEKGKGIDARVFWSGVPEINAQLAASAMRWKFRPPTRRGQPVRAWVPFGLTMQVEADLDRILQVQQAMPKRADDMPVLVPLKPEVPAIVPAAAAGVVPFAEIDSPPVPEKYKVDIDDVDVTTTYRFLVYVSEAGQVRDFRWLAIPHPAAVAWLERSVRAWTWTPGKLAGRATGSWTQVSLEVKLQLQDFEPKSLRALKTELPH